MSMKLVFGEKVVPKPVHHENDADNVWGPAWHAWRTADGYVLEYATGDLAGNDRQFAISADEFEQLRAEPERFEDIVDAHGG
jgi:hypothetical protein